MPQHPNDEDLSILTFTVVVLFVGLAFAMFSVFFL